MIWGYEREDIPSLSPCPVIGLSKILQLSDEAHEGAGDNDCFVMNCVFSKYLGDVLLSHGLKKKQETL